MTSAPVAFVIFNRPDTTRRVFAEIAKARPPKLLVIADGPRANHPNDVEKCAAVRAIINGVNWVFDTVEEAIILEDDCLLHPTFFRFCEEMLEKYRYT
jgi:hypothetical protein